MNYSLIVFYEKYLIFFISKQALNGSFMKTRDFSAHQWIARRMASLCHTELTIPITTMLSNDKWQH